MLVVSANRYLLKESHARRLSAVSQDMVRSAWASMNRPPVLEFQYDLLTQRELLMLNLKTLKLYGECAENPIVLNAAMYGWKTMAKEMNVRTFCQPDSVIRKWMHDAHKIFEMLGTALPMFLAFQELQVKTLAKVNEEQRKKMERMQQREGRVAGGGHSRKASAGSQQDELMRSVGDGVRKLALNPTPASQTIPKVRKATGGDGAIARSPSHGSNLVNSDGYENTWSGKLGMLVQDIGR